MWVKRVSYIVLVSLLILELVPVISYALSSPTQSVITTTFNVRNPNYPVVLVVGGEGNIKVETRDNFLKYLTDVREYELPSPVRGPKQYLDFVKRILEGVKGNPGNFDFRIFDDITDMLNELENRRKEGSRKIALVRSFTESEGDTKDKTSWESIKNIRIGYPLQSGFDLYKGVKFKGERLKIKWLMDERVEYPRYWNGELEPLKYCSSVYGAQGFEADYVGVVWGRDLIWRNNGWTVNPNPITDNVGGRFSFKDNRL